jgi:integrase
VSSNRQYLEQRHNTWHVVVEIPKALRPKAGQKRFKRSLATDSLTEANKLKWAHVAEFKRRIELLRTDAEGAGRDALFRDALEHREWLQQASDYLPADAPAGAYSNREHVLDDIKERARDLAEDDPETARRYFMVATGAATFIRATSTAWLSERTGSVRASVLDQQRAVINRYLHWAGEHATIEETNRRRAGAYVIHLRSPASTLETSTARRHVSGLSALWQWLIERGMAETNPWRGHRWPKKGNGRSVMPDASLVKLLTGTPDARSRYGGVLHDLVRLALTTGARLEELCALRVEDVEQREDGWWLLIREYEGHKLKSPAANREVPLHASAAHIVTRRKRSGQHFLFPDLTRGGPDNRRSWNVSRAFAAYRKGVGVTGRGEVFHALRNTFVEHMEAAGVAESTVQLLVGHARHSLTYGRYSKGELVNLREAINQLSYSDDVSKHIATNEWRNDDLIDVRLAPISGAEADIS